MYNFTALLEQGEILAQKSTSDKLFKLVDTNGYDLLHHDIYSRFGYLSYLDFQ